MAINRALLPLYGLIRSWSVYGNEVMFVYLDLFGCLLYMIILYLYIVDDYPMLFVHCR